MFFLVLSVLSTAIAVPQYIQDGNDFFTDLETSKASQSDFFDESPESNGFVEANFENKLDDSVNDAMTRDNRDKWGPSADYGMNADDDVTLSEKYEMDDEEDLAVSDSGHDMPLSEKYEMEEDDGFAASMDSEEMQVDDDVYDLWPWPKRKSQDSEFRNDCAVVVSLWKAMGKRTILRPGLVLQNGCCMGAPFFLFNDIPGVTCEDGKVTDIDWYHKGLKGSIPPTIKNLKNLKNVWLSYNSLSGAIPEEVSQLTTLEGLWLNNNQISGNIPAEISSLSSLSYLFLNNNKLTGEIPKELGQLSSLEGLYLNNNDLSGNIPEELSELKKLRYLYLNNNNFSGSIPSGITSLEDLKYL